MATNTQSTLRLQSGATVSSTVNPTGATVTRKAASQAPTVIMKKSSNNGEFDCHHLYVKINGIGPDWVFGLGSVNLEKNTFSGFYSRGVSMGFSFLLSGFLYPPKSGYTEYNGTVYLVVVPTEYTLQSQDGTWPNWANPWSIYLINGGHIIKRENC